MRIAHKLALLVALALAAIGVSATAAFATSPSVDTSETATVVTVNGANPAGSYTAYSTNALLNSDNLVTPVCESNATFTIDVTGDGAITGLEYVDCSDNCTVSPITINDGGFTVTGATTQTTRATFVLDGQDGTADLTGTVTCTGVFTCTFTTTTGNTSATAFVANVTEGDPGTLSFTDATVATDTILACNNASLSADYTLDDPTTGNTGVTAKRTATGLTTPTITSADDVTISP